MPAKYSNKKTVIGDVSFDSRAEARRWGDLKLMERAGLIAGITLQPSYELAPSVKFTGATRAKPALRYVGDFAYTDLKTGLLVIEDVKGVQTEAFIIKRHLMKSIHGLDVTLVSRPKR